MSDYDTSPAGPLFAAAESQAAKAEGMTRAADAAETPLAVARRIAVELATANPNKETNADFVGERLAERGIELGPAAGSLFRGACWEFTGKRVASSRVSNHGREIKVWRYVG